MTPQSAGPDPSDRSRAGGRDRIQLFALEATAKLGRAVADALGEPLSRREERDFEDGEHKSRPLDNVASRDVYVLQSLHSGPTMTANDKLCERDLLSERRSVVIGGRHRTQKTASTVVQGMLELARAWRVASSEPSTPMPRHASSSKTTSKPQRRASSAE